VATESTLSRISSADPVKRSVGGSYETLTTALARTRNVSGVAIVDRLRSGQWRRGQKEHEQR
jgi:hypothetical protein